MTLRAIASAGAGHHAASRKPASQPDQAEQPAADTSDFATELAASRSRLLNLALEVGFLEHDDPTEAVRAAAALIQENDAHLLAFIETRAAELEAAAKQRN